MAIDISSYLDEINDETGGPDVLEAIYTSMDILNQQAYRSMDVEADINVIKTGVFGKDIRFYIADALEKMANTIPKGNTIVDDAIIIVDTVGTNGWVVENIVEINE